MSELKRLAELVLRESPPPTTDWHEAALRVCRAVLEAPPLATGFENEAFSLESVARKLHEAQIARGNTLTDMLPQKP